MRRRLCNLLLSYGFLPFGARGTGKSTLVKSLLSPLNPLIMNLLESSQIETALNALPEHEARIEAAVETGRAVFLYEVQKAPRLLYIAQRLLDEQKARCAISGSNARNLRGGGAL